MPYPYQMYQPNYYGNMQMQANPIPQQNTAMQNTVQNGGFISVPSEDIAMSYPVEPGKCVTFKIEGKPIVMEKSMGFSQLEAPKVERYRLVKEDVPVSSQKASESDLNQEVIENSINTLKSEIEALWKELEGIKNTSAKKPSNSKREKDGDD